MRDGDEDLVKDPLYLALTRPPMLFGVPFQAAMACGFISGFAMIIADNVFLLGLIVPLFAVCRLIVKKDPNAFRVLFKFTETKARCMNRSFWGGSSSSPLRVVRKYSRQDHEA